MAFRSKEGNIVHTLNNLQPGLNFVVPAFWWDNLCLKNISTKHINEIIMPENAPLDSLIELQIIKSPLTSYADEFAHLMDKCQKSSVSITKQIKMVKEQEKPQQPGKRARPSYDWWKNYLPESQGNYHKIMYSPSINLDTARNLGWQDDLEWRVVSPLLYKLIHKHESFTKGQPYDTSLVAIPIFLSQGSYPSVLSYKLIRRHFTSVYFCNFSRFDYCFMGYIEEHVRYSDLLKGLYEGLELLTDKCSSFYKEFKRNKIYYINDEIYSEFYDQEDCPQKLGWRSFAALAQETVGKNGLNIREIVEYSYFSENCSERQQNQSQMVEETEQVGLSGIKPSKKIKQNEDLQHTQKKQGFYAVVQQRERSYTPYIIGGNFAPTQIEVITNVADVPSSTQGQTPEEMILEKPFKEVPKQELSRIAFPLWSGQSVTSFRKVSELRQNNFIPTLKPFRGHTDRLVMRDANNKKVYFQRNCNKLKRIGEDQLVEEEAIAQVIDEDSSIPQDICAYLQDLALNVLWKPQTALQIQKAEQQDQEAQLSKKQLDFDSQTCKNQDIDSQASRQY